MVSGTYNYSFHGLFVNQHSHPVILWSGMPSPRDFPHGQDPRPNQDLPMGFPKLEGIIFQMLMLQGKNTGSSQEKTISTHYSVTKSRTKPSLITTNDTGNSEDMDENKHENGCKTKHEHG